MQNTRSVGRIIVLTGPESTGKSVLARQLAAHFGGASFPEYARSYLEERDTSAYTYEDVETIARGQLQQYIEAQTSDADYVFLDTWLIITKVWFRWVYDKEPLWLEDAIASYPVDLYLLCQPDLEWEADPLRENGGDNRLALYDEYKKELMAHGCNFGEIGGEGEKRLWNAVEKIVVSG